jgi:hypothetical protein
LGPRSGSVAGRLRSRVANKLMSSAANFRISVRLPASETRRYKLNRFGVYPEFRAAVIAFEELNFKDWHGDSIAVRESLE